MNEAAALNVEICSVIKYCEAKKIKVELLNTRPYDIINITKRLNLSLNVVNTFDKKYQPNNKVVMITTDNCSSQNCIQY